VNIEKPAGRLAACPRPGKETKACRLLNAHKGPLPGQSVSVAKPIRPALVRAGSHYHNPRFAGCQASDVGRFPAGVFGQVRDELAEAGEVFPAAQAAETDSSSACRSSAASASARSARARKAVTSWRSASS